MVQTLRDLFRVYRIEKKNDVESLYNTLQYLKEEDHVDMVFVDMDTDCVEDMEIELKNCADLVPLILIINKGENLHRLLSPNFMWLFSGYVLKPTMLSDVKVIKNTLDLGYPYLPPSLSYELSFLISRHKARKERIRLLRLNESYSYLFGKHEMNIINGFLEAKTSKQICSELFIARSTLSTLMGKLLKRFEVESRTELITKLIRENYVITDRETDKLDL